MAEIADGENAAFLLVVLLTMESMESSMDGLT
jgi:hypothetical protein